MKKLVKPFNYQEDFFTPGISPLLASSRKQIRQRSNWRKYPCLRPHFQHRLTMRVENFGVLSALAAVDVFAIWISVYYFSFLTSSCCSGKPRRRNNASPSFLFFAVVTMFTWKLKVCCTFSGTISGNTRCSLIPRLQLPL